jgi:UDP-glucuronate 4-epimerase
MKFLVTGSAGFIGYHITRMILENFKGSKVIGIDNLNGYYSVQLKKKRIKILRNFMNFKFKKIDISNSKKISSLFKKNNFDIVIHMAAQPGVRYSMINPKVYFSSNIEGFLNIIENCNLSKVKKFLFASSSSVYGDQKKYPLKENYNLNPNNIYSYTKKNNEDVASDLSKSKFFKMKIVALRFFTIYGDYARPDMFIYKFLNFLVKKKTFYLNNYGNHKRDFTHIEDVKNIIAKLILNKKLKNYQVFNVCSSRPVSILKLSFLIQNILQLKNRIIKIKKHRADALVTHGNNRKIKNFLKIGRFRNIFDEIENVIQNYIEKKIFKYL